MNGRTAPRRRRWAALAAGALLLGTAGASRGADETPTPLPGRLGMTEAELRAEFGEALKASAIERPVPFTEQITRARRQAAEAAGLEPIAPAPAPEPRDLYTEQERFERQVGRRDVSRVEYQLFRGKVYRIRWQLSDRFERSLMNPLVAHLKLSLGAPLYDQQIEGKLAAGTATLRRAGWRRGIRTLEVRQLHPFTGGPLYLTVSDEAAIRAIIAARGAVQPEPDSIGAWWQEPVRGPTLLTPEERDLLLRSIDALLAQIDF